MPSLSLRSSLNDTTMKNVSNKLEDVNEIKSILQKRNIEWLCHFTPRKNLENIRRNGLRLRDELDFGSTVTDEKRFDPNRNAICLSISKPNKWMFNRKCEEGFDLCLLLINPDILFKKQCVFYPHNAATASYRNIDISSLQGSKSLEDLFANPIQFQRSGKEPQSIWRSEFLKLYDTTSDQAEVQCLENIEPFYIDYIIEDNIPLTYDEISQFVRDRNIIELRDKVEKEVEPKLKNIKIDQINKANELNLAKSEEEVEFLESSKVLDDNIGSSRQTKKIERKNSDSNVSSNSGSGYWDPCDLVIIGLILYFIFF